MSHKQRILIVEDVIWESDFLKDVLSDFNCEAAYTFQEAVEKLSQSRYDLVLLDLKLPLDDVDPILMEPDDTLERLPKLLDRCLNSSVWIIVVTAYPTYGSAWAAVQNERIYDYLIKLVPIDHLIRIIRMALSNEPRALKLNRYEAIIERIDRVAYSIPNHSERVARLSANMLSQLRKEGREIERCHLLGRLHDIGKLGMRQEWEQLLGDQNIQSIKDINARLEPMNSDKRLVQLIPRMFRFEAELGHYYETFLIDELGRERNQVGLAAAIAIADAYYVYAFCKGAEFSLDDAMRELQRQGFSQTLIDALRKCLATSNCEEPMSSSEQKRTVSE